MKSIFGRFFYSREVVSRFAITVASLLLALLRPLWAADYEITDKRDLIRVETSSYATERHTQTVKILTDQGADYKEYLPTNSYIQIKNIDVTIRTQGGQTSRLKKDQIYEVPIVESPDMVTDYKAIVIAPQNLHKGDTVHIQYDRAITSLLYMDPWVYTSNVPIQRASCTLTFPGSISVKYRGEDPQVKIQKSDAGGVTTIVFETTNRAEVLLSGKSEAFSSIEKKVVFLPEQALTEKWVLSTRSWTDVAQWFSELTRFAYREDPGMDQVVRQVKSNASSPEQIAQAIYQYIQENFVYMAIEIGIGGYKPRSAAHTFQKKYGDCKDLTFLYLVLLKKAGIEGYPALVDTRHSKFFYRDFPSPSQFNHCIAYLPGIGKGIWVDTTVKNFRLGEMPAVIQGKQALVAGGPNSLLRIPEDFYNSNVLRFELEGAHNSGGLTMKGAVHTLGQANAYLELMKNALMRNSVKSYVYGTLLKGGLPLQRLQTKKTGDRSISLDFMVPVTTVEPYQLLLLNPVSYPALQNVGMEPRDNEFFALGVPIRLVLDTRIDLGGRTLASPAQQKQHKGEYVQYNLQIQEERGTLRYVADVYFANGFLDSGEMKKYAKEIEAFASQLQRTILVR